MSKVELKVIQTAIRGTRDLIKTLNDGKELPIQLEKMFYQLNEYSIILSEMIDEVDNHA